MTTTRRAFLGALAVSGIGAAMARVLPVSAAVPVAQARQSARPGAPDAGGYVRPYDWSVCLPPQEWATHGDWVMQKTLELLHPDHWHTWGTWLDSDVPGRIPMIYSAQHFDQAGVLRRMRERNGEVWMGPGEPEVPEQADDTPESVADLTCTLIDIGQASGSDWQWGSPAVTLNTRYHGLEWLTEWTKIMRRKRGIAFPFTWFIHPYPSNSVQALHDSMDAWWNWHAKWGGKTETVISEVCAEGSQIDVQKDVMSECHKMWKDGDVKGVFWFAAYRSIHNEEKRFRQDRVPWLNYWLTTLNYEAQTVTLTELGQHWKTLQ